MKKKIILSALALAVLGVIGVWYFIFYKPVHNRRDVNKEQAINVEALQLVKDFTANEAAANNKYVNKVIQTSGVVNNTTEDSTSTTIFIATQDTANTISCRLTKKQSVEKGSNVVIKGVLTGYILNEIQLNEGMIVSVSAPIKVSPPVDTLHKQIPSDTIKQKAVPAVNSIIKSNKASIRFFSSTPAEDIEATNTQIISNINTSTGAMNIAALIKGFRFENELMQDHFNQPSYMNSEAFPKATFIGTITNIKDVNFTANGTYNVKAKGSLTIHGVSKDIEIPGTITVDNASVKVKSVFKIHVQDFGVDGSEVAEQIEITVNAAYSLK